MDSSISMNWDAIGAVGEMAGAAAVVLSLVYLARQVTTSNRLARAEAYRNPNSDLNSLNAAFGTDPVWRRAMARAYFEGAQRSDLDPEDTMVLDVYLISVTNIFEQLYREIREGILDDHALLDFGGNNLLKLPYYQSSWSLIRENMGHSFVEYLENRLEIVPKVQE